MSRSLPAATKLGQGNVFTGVCDSVHRRGGVSASVHAGMHPPREDTPKSRHPPPPPAYGQRAAGTHPTGMHSRFIMWLMSLSASKPQHSLRNIIKAVADPEAGIGARSMKSTWPRFCSHLFMTYFSKTRGWFPRFTDEKWPKLNPKLQVHLQLWFVRKRHCCYRYCKTVKYLTICLSFTWKQTSS